MIDLFTLPLIKNESPARSFITEEIMPQTPMTPLMTADTNKRDKNAQTDILIGPPSTVPDEAEDRYSYFVC